MKEKRNISEISRLCNSVFSGHWHSLPHISQLNILYNEYKGKIGRAQEVAWTRDTTSRRKHLEGISKSIAVGKWYRGGFRKGHKLESRSKMNWLKTYLWKAPRWFGLPAATCSIILGSLLAGGKLWLTLIAIVCGLGLMAYSHTFNSVLDWLTGLDKGPTGERSRTKDYTEGQNLIALSHASLRGLIITGLLWLALSAFLAYLISRFASPWVWLPWGLIAIMTFLYSWGKLHYTCELWLGLGFGSFAAMLGSCGVANPPLLTAFLAGIPFAILFGFAAEFVDQAIDAEPNYPKGLRNLGALAWRNNISITLFTGFLIVFTYLSQIFLIVGGILAPLTGITLIVFPLFAYGLLIMGEKFNKKGIFMLLIAVFVYMIALVVGQAIS